MYPLLSRCFWVNGSFVGLLVELDQFGREMSHWWSIGWTCCCTCWPTWTTPCWIFIYLGAFHHKLLNLIWLNKYLNNVFSNNIFHIFADVIPLNFFVSEIVGYRRSSTKKCEKWLMVCPISSQDVHVLNVFQVYLHNIIFSFPPISPPGFFLLLHLISLYLVC